MASEAEVSLRRSLRRWRIGCLASVLVLVATIVAAAYSVVDAGISLTYRDASLRSALNAEALLERVVLEVSRSTTKPELFDLLRELDTEPFEKHGGVHADELSFYFTSDGTLACVTAGYPPEDTRCASFADPE